MHLTRENVKTDFSRHFAWYISGLSLLFSAIVFLFYSSSLSPLFPAYSYDAMNRDSEFYLWTGLEILEGKKPYIDFYDHKGPLVFYLNALGMAMGGRYGMGLLLAIAHFVTSFFLLLLIYKKTKKISRVFFASALLLLLYGTNGSGNQNGDIAAPLCSLSLYFFFSAFGRKADSPYWYLSLACAGCEVSVSLFARPSDAIFGSAVCLAYFVCWCCNRKTWGIRLLWGILSALAGFVFLSAVFAGIFFSLGVLEPYFRAVFGDSNGYLFRLSPKDAVYSRLIVCAYLILSLLSFLFIRKRLSEEEKLPVLVQFVLAMTNGALQLLIAKYPQYWISMFPLIVYQVVHDVGFFWGDKNERPSHAVSYGTIAALTVALGLAVYYPAFYHASNLIYYSASSNGKIRDEIEEVIPKEDLKEKDRVYYLNTSAAALWNYDSQNSCPYQTMQSWHSRFKPEVEESVTSYLSSVRPEYVVKENDKDEGDYTFLTYLYAHYVEEDPSPEHDSPIVTVYRYVG